MVAVRSAHLNKAGEFDPQKWIASLGISSQQSCERLTETWAYCLRTTQGHPDAPAWCADNRPRFRLSVHTTAGWKFPDLRSIFVGQIPQLY